MAIKKEYIKKNIEELIPYEFNNKKHSKEQVDKIINSIKENEYINPIIIDENWIILSWHWRLEALRKLNYKEVEVIRINWLTESQKKKYRILDNRLADLAEYDLENLKVDLGELEDESLNKLFEEFSLNIEELDDDFNLPSWDKWELETITFTLHREQNIRLKEALEISKSMWDFWETWNDNSNWNALARIVDIFLLQNN